jgi:nicotinate phosphoribosyltransferase
MIDPSLAEIKEFARRSLDSLWDEYKRDLNPQDYPVDLSQDCYDNKVAIIKRVREYVGKLKF